MNNTPQGDGNTIGCSVISFSSVVTIRMNNTPQGDGNLYNSATGVLLITSLIRMNNTPQGDGNLNSVSLAISKSRIRMNDTP